jgi:hypothetical protein
LRVVEYSGPRDIVEKTVAGSIHGEKHWPTGLVIRAATIGSYPEILAKAGISTKDEIQPETAPFNGYMVYDSIHKRIGLASAYNDGVYLVQYGADGPLSTRHASLLRFATAAEVKDAGLDGVGCNPPPV